MFTLHSRVLLSVQGVRTPVLSQRHCRASQAVLPRMVPQPSIRTVTSAREPAESYHPPASGASAFGPLPSRVFAAPDALLLVFFSCGAAERKAVLVTTKQSYTFVSNAFLSMLEMQRFHWRRHVKPLPQKVWVGSRFGDREEQGDLARWLYFLHPHVGYRDIAAASLSAHNQRRFEAPTSGFQKIEVAEQWYFRARGATTSHILYMMYDYGSSQWISEQAFYELSM